MTLTALILGAGPGVGHSVAAKLISAGYAVAAASRTPDASIAQKIGFHPVKIDLSQPDTVPGLFSQVQKTLGAAPNVVVYNAWAATFAPDPEAILSGISAAQLSAEHNVNTVSMWAAAQAAVEGWKTLDAAAPRAFIFTGNVLPWVNMPAYVSLGIGKTSSAHIIEALANTYGKKGSRFYFAYQVSHTDGGLYHGIDGPATANTYLELINRSEQGSWRIAFDKDGKDWHAAEKL